MGTLEAQNRQVVERYWEAHFARDWDRMATFFAPSAHYTDVGVDGVGATGPSEIIARLQLGIEPLTGYYHHPRHTIAEGNLVVTEHTEHWHFPTGERVSLPFVSVHRLRGGRITLWRDYWNWSTLMEGVPQWWLDDIAAGYR